MIAQAAEMTTFHARKAHMQAVVDRIDRERGWRPRRVVGSPGEELRIVDAVTGRYAEREACYVPGCKRKQYVGDLCQRHYKRIKACGFPDQEQWIAAGAPTSSRWFRHPTPPHRGQ